MLGEGKMWQARDSLEKCMLSWKDVNQGGGNQTSEGKEELPRGEKVLVQFIKSLTKPNLQARSTHLLKVLANSGSCHKLFLPNY